MTALCVQRIKKWAEHTVLGNDSGFAGRQCVIHHCRLSCATSKKERWSKCFKGLLNHQMLLDGIESRAEINEKWSVTESAA